jgi:uncharacterized protein (UPF0548 family)
MDTVTFVAAHVWVRVACRSGRLPTRLSRGRCIAVSGLAVAAEGPAEDGRTVVLGIGRPLVLVMPCRVVYVVNEPDRKGFGYGSLTGHPEQGEESFVVVIDTDGTVRLEITAFSRPDNTLIRASGAVGRRIQARATRRYERPLTGGRLGTGSDS